MKKNWPLYVVLSVVLLAGYIVPELRTFRHASVFIILFISVLNKRVRLGQTRFVFLFLCLLVYGLLVSTDNFSILTFKFFLLFLSPIVGAFIFSASLRHVVSPFLKLLFFTSVIFQFMAIFKSGHGFSTLGIFQLLNSNQNANVFLSTSSEIENSFGFIFGYFGLYFLMRKKYRYFAICFFLFVLNYKRVVLLGFVAATGYLLFVQLIRPKKIPFKTLITVSPFLILSLLIAVSSGDLNSVALDLTGKTMNHLTTGRYAMYHELFNNLFELPRLFFGYGVGFSSSNVRLFEFTRMTLVHSDYLMIMYDFGLFGFTFFFALFMKQFLKSARHAVFIIFFLVILIFDNTIIYYDVMFLLYLLLINETRHMDFLKAEVTLK